MLNKISKLIEGHNLQPGDTMKNAIGHEVPNSSVLDSRSCIIQQKDNPQIYTIMRDQTMTGALEEIILTEEALNQIGLYARDMNVFGKKL